MKKFNEFINESNENLQKTVIWFSGDGSAYPTWFLTEDESEFHQDNMYEGWGECCNGSVETFIGSDIHKKAVANSEEQKSEREI